MGWETRAQERDLELSQTLVEALRHRLSGDFPADPTTAAVPTDPSPWRAKRRRIFHSVFQTEITQPTPYSTPALNFSGPGQAFGGPGPRGAASAGGPASTAAFSATDLQGGRLGQPAAASFLLRSPGAAFQAPAGVAEDQVRFDRAWHVVTARIALPSSVAAEDSFGTLAAESQLLSQDASTEADFQAALRLVLSAKDELPLASHTEDVRDWHTQQVRRHFVQHVLPMVAAVADGPDARDVSDKTARAPRGKGVRHYDQHMAVVQGSIRTLEAALRLYYYGMALIVRGVEQDGDDGVGKDVDEPVSPAETLKTRFRREVNALVGNSATESLMLSIRIVLSRLAAAILGVHAIEEAAGVDSGSSASARGRRPALEEDDAAAQAARRRLHELVDSLHRVGLAGERFQIMFAEVMDDMMSTFVQLSYAGVWTASEAPEQGRARHPRSRLGGAPSRSISSLYDWIEDHYARLVIEILGRICTGGEARVLLSDLKKWKEVGLGRLASLRISELFDIVLAWPASRGGLEDLRASVGTPERRSQVVAAFSATLQRRLLHPGPSTLDILRVYIAVIRTFHALDQSNVLLAGAVAPLQLYLCQRDDAVRIVVTGLLASPQEVQEAGLAVPESGREPGAARTRPAGKADKLVELAVLLKEPNQQRHAEEEELDWNDMDWVPDPVDAGANYKRPKSEDVIGTVIGALGSQDAFIKEFQNIVAERLLSAQTGFEQEERVLRLLKKRFGDAALQNCDVMIKDITESRRLDAAVWRVQRQQQAPATPDPAAREPGAGRPAYQARILSRLFWPALGRDDFALPGPVADLQRRYEAGYEHLKAGRRLAWLPHLGQATVELELADRTVTVDCATHEAAVVYAFQPDAAAAEADDAEVAPVRRSAARLQEMLRMDDDLVRLALAFWVRQGVLRPAGGDEYEVAETQSDGTPPGAASAPAPPAAAAEPARDKGADAAEQARRGVYWQFIVGMLTNAASSMPLAQIAMMMKMLIADGFAWSAEELQEFLAEKVGDGELEVVGGKYRLVRK